MAKNFNCRPSQLYGLNDAEDEWLAWCVDRAHLTWGMAVEAWMKETKEVPRQKTRPRDVQLVPAHEPEWITRMIYGPLPEANPLPGEESGELGVVRAPRLSPDALAPDADVVPSKYRSANAKLALKTMRREA